MVHVVLVRPGATELDEQKRIKGSLDMPLCSHGQQQARETAAALAGVAFDAIFCAPCESAQETARQLANQSQFKKAKVKVVEGLRNVDHGLWHGKLIADVRRQLPRVYREGQDAPKNLCPPEGESIQHAWERAGAAIDKIVRKHRNATIALVIADPLASIVRSQLSGQELRDLWDAETDGGTWEWVATTAVEQRRRDNRPTSKVSAARHLVFGS